MRYDVLLVGYYEADDGSICFEEDLKDWIFINATRNDGEAKCPINVEEVDDHQHVNLFLHSFGTHFSINIEYQMSKRLHSSEFETGE